MSGVGIRFGAEALETVARVEKRSSNLVGWGALAYSLLQLTDCRPLKLEQSRAFPGVGLLDRCLLLRRSTSRY